MVDATIFLEQFCFVFVSQKLLRNTFSSLLPSAAQTAQTKEFMFQNVAYKPTVHRTGMSTPFKNRTQGRDVIVF